MSSGILAARNIDGPALIIDGQSTISYSQLVKEVERISAKLPKRELFFLLGGNDLPTIICYLAALDCGAVPLVLGNGLSRDQVDRLISIYDPGFIFSNDCSNWGCKESFIEWGLGEYIFYRRKEVLAKVLHDDLALLLATSGSTGSPKLVRLSLRNIVKNAESIVSYLGIVAGDRAITSLPFNYSYGLSVINSHLIAGASIVLSNASLMDKSFWQQVNKYSVTSFAGVPYSYEILIKLRFNQMHLPTIKTLTQAGGRLNPEKMQQINKICCEKDIKFFPMYGQTEATARIAYLSPEYIETKLGSIGRAIPGGELWLENESEQRISEPEEVGELVYRGENVSLGYAECLGDLALGDINQGVLRTGDLAYTDKDGFFFLQGRLRRFLKVFGIRISLDAVEEVARSKGFECAAQGVDDRLDLFVIEKEALSVQGLRDSMAISLGIPSAAIKVYFMNDLPRLSTGKVDYQCLSKMT